MKKKMTVLLAALCAIFLFAACSESPSEAVETHFRKLQNMTVEEVKADIQKSADAIYDKKFKYYWEEDENVESEEDAKALATADKERYLKSFADWNEDSYRREARNRSETFAFATLQIVSEEIKGNEAEVTTVITFRGNIKEDKIFKLKKNSSGSWEVLPDAAEEEQSVPAESSGDAESESEE